MKIVIGLLIAWAVLVSFYIELDSQNYKAEHKQLNGNIEDLRTAQSNGFVYLVRDNRALRARISRLEKLARKYNYEITD